MSTTTETPETAEQRDINKEDFFGLVRFEGVTIDGKTYAATGTGKATRYHAYDPGVVKGFDAIREDGEVVAQEVANHEEALIEDLSKSDLDPVYEKFKDGFGARGAVRVSTPPETADDEGDEPEYEPMGDEEVLETVVANFDEHGSFFAENDDGEEKVVSLTHPDGKLMGYITGSHVKAQPNDLESVDDYRNAVATALHDASYGGLPHDFGADDVPIAPGGLMEKFAEWGHQTTESGFDFAAFNKARWEDGEYDHLRSDENGDE